MVKYAYKFPAETKVIEHIKISRSEFSQNSTRTTNDFPGGKISYKNRSNFPNVVQNFVKHIRDFQRNTIRTYQILQ